ncbi:MAG: pyridoxamine 5'-phosphate oxidase family protein [Nitrososphaerota archaeon]|nr:pyridoxamine 5'-phosphate oxidase family protein [Aigarchaeota archaeon]MDW8076215.1 pyridoxamine 5'-phosphate oxidase family protein [Nitrososphaerota archaeon]
MLELKRKYANFLKKQRVGRLGTISEDGTVHLVPVCYAFDGKAIYIGTEVKSKKVRNLKRNPATTLLVDVYYENWNRLKSLMVQGTAELYDGGEEFAYARRLLYRKYKQYEKMAPINEGESIIIKLIPKKVIASNF